jgi:1-acyl-sn-glycerol-3-phosphate acyltransferase
MNTFRACWKLTRVAIHMISGLATITLIFPKLNQAQKNIRIQAWALVLLDKIAITLVVDGEQPKPGPVLLVANHVSWLDIYIVLATSACRFVAKSEVRQWPLVGRLAVAAGTLFITRQSPRDALRVVHQMTEHLQTGDKLAVFPEGTTSNGLQVLPFHSNLFQAVISAEVSVQPVALQYSDLATGQPSMAPIYIDHDSLMASIWRTLKAPPLRATLNFGAPQHPQGRDRRTLAADVRAAVNDLRSAP